MIFAMFDYWMRLREPLDMKDVKTYIEDLETYANCKNTGIWPGYSEEIKPLNLPSWLQ